MKPQIEDFRYDILDRHHSRDLNDFALGEAIRKITGPWQMNEEYLQFLIQRTLSSRNLGLGRVTASTVLLQVIDKEVPLRQTWPNQLIVLDALKFFRAPINAFLRATGADKLRYNSATGAYESVKMHGYTCSESIRKLSTRDNPAAFLIPYMQGISSIGGGFSAGGDYDKTLIGLVTVSLGDDK